MREYFSSLNPGGGEGAYSYKGRDHSSRSAARERRFGETDITGSGSFQSKAPLGVKSLPLDMNLISRKAVPVQGSADIMQDGTVDLHLKTSLSRLGGREQAADRAADTLEPIVPHYLNLTTPYTLKQTPAQQKFYTWAGKPGQTQPASRLGDYTVSTNVIQ